MRDFRVAPLLGTVTVQVSLKLSSTVVTVITAMLAVSLLKVFTRPVPVIVATIVSLLHHITFLLKTFINLSSI